jgi:hypothetical protein
MNIIFGQLHVLAALLLGNKPYTHGIRDCTFSRDDVASCIFLFLMDHYILACILLPAEVLSMLAEAD